MELVIRQGPVCVTVEMDDSAAATANGGRSNAAFDPTRLIRLASCVFACMSAPTRAAGDQAGGEQLGGDQAGGEQLGGGHLGGVGAATPVPATANKSGQRPAGR